jgi:3-methyladenine DNA glycosylase/8-oxoguanine DNA glycosylase
MARPTSSSQIASILAQRDSHLSRVIELVGPPPSRRAIPVADRFEDLATSILHQQLAGAAAATITRRTIDALGGSISADAILAASPGQLRGCGVSGAKELALLDLATHVDDGRLDLEHLGRLEDAVVVDRLSDVRGIGRWTAEMFLMGPLGRHDVWPVGDLGVRNGFSLLKRKRSVIAPKELEALGERYRPYRSSVAWYCWKAVDLARANGGTLPR